MRDLIDRQDVLDEIVRFSTEEGSSVECQQLYCDVNNMPSVTQKPIECDDAVSRILKIMWNCRGKHTTSIDKVKMEQIIRDELPSVTRQTECESCQMMSPDNCEECRQKSGVNCDTCEIGNPCLYCKYEFEPQESEDKE